MKICTIRPFNAVSGIFTLLIIVFSLPIPFYVKDIVNGVEKVGETILPILIYLLIFGWLGIYLFSIIFRPKIILYKEHMEVTHWENGIPYNRQHPLRFPRTIKTIIPYHQLTLYGAFFIKDIQDYIKKDSGLLYKQWAVVASTPFPIPIKLPELTTKLRDVVLLVKDDGQSVIVDGGQYGLRQIEYLLYQLEECTNIKSVGRVKPQKHLNSFVLNFIKAIITICWLTVIPISTIWLEGVINVSHLPSFQSIWRTLYVLCILGANLFLTGYISARKQQRSDTQMCRVKKVCGGFSIILYILFILFFALSTNQ